MTKVDNKLKHLKTYKIFENQTNEHWEIHDILVDLFEEFNYELPDFVKKYPTQHNIQLESHKCGSIEISDYYVFNAKCLRIRITDNGKSFGEFKTIKRGMFKGFDGLNNSKYSSILQECNQRIISYLQPVEVIIGSVGNHTRDLDLLYFYNKPDFSRFGDVEIYGSNIGIELDKITYPGKTKIVELTSNSRHSNGFDSLNDQFFMMYYYDGWFYNRKLVNLNKTENNFNKWVNSEWEKVCKKMKIKTGEKVTDNPKITVAEFMTHLKNNQDNAPTWSHIN